MKKRGRIKPSWKHVKVGERFGKWLVVEADATSTSWGARRVICLCDCGVRRSVQQSLLKRGASISCGCWRTELLRSRRGLEYRTYRELYPDLLAIWSSMKERCQFKSSSSYINYGGRGITVCTEWRDSFTQFVRDMGPRPSEQHSIDRINNDGNYEPGNCRWADQITQTINRRNTLLFTWKGESKALSQICRLENVSYQNTRINIGKGMTIEEAVDKVRLSGKPFIERAKSANNRAPEAPNFTPVSFKDEEKLLTIWKAHKLQLTDSWRDSFVQFVSDVGPVNGKLERIDSSKPFSPNNFRWISTNQLFWQGEWKTLHAICKQENVRYKNVHQFCKRGRSLIESIRYAKQRKLTA